MSIPKFTCAVLLTTPTSDGVLLLPEMKETFFPSRRTGNHTFPFQFTTVWNQGCCFIFHVMKPKVVPKNLQLRWKFIWLVNLYILLFFRKQRPPTSQDTVPLPPLRDAGFIASAALIEFPLQPSKFAFSSSTASCTILFIRFSRRS